MSVGCTRSSRRSILGRPNESPLVKIATWNVNGIRARQTQLLEFVERERPDVLCLQEIKASLD